MNAVLEHLITHPLAPTLICDSHNSPLAGGIVNRPHNDFHIIGSCIVMNYCLTRLFGTSPSYLWNQIQDVEYPCVFTLQHFSHVSTILAFDKFDIIYIDYYEETDRFLYPDQYPYAPVNVVKLSEQELIRILVDHFNQKFSRDIYDKIIGPNEDLSEDEYRDEYIITEIYSTPLVERSYFEYVQMLQDGLTRIRTEIADADIKYLRFFSPRRILDSDFEYRDKWVEVSLRSLDRHIEFLELE